MAAEANLQLSPAAEADLEEIWSYSVETWSWQQAEIYHNDIIGVMQDLALRLRTGRQLDVRDGYWKYPVGSHVVFYRQLERGIEVIRILHQRMDVARHLH